MITLTPPSVTSGTEGDSDVMVACATLSNVVNPNTDPMETTFPIAVTFELTDNTAGEHAYNNCCSYRISWVISRTFFSNSWSIFLFVTFIANPMHTYHLSTCSHTHTHYTVLSADYGSVMSSVTFPVGSVEDAMMCATISIFDDDNIEGNETLSITIMTAQDGSGNNNPVEIEGTSMVTFTIMDNDSKYNNN